MAAAGKPPIKIHAKGTILGEKYEVMGEPLGVGGFGVVYPVRHTISRDRGALKILHEHLTQSPKFVQSFLAEVRRPSGFRDEPGTFGRHPYKRVVRVTDAGVDTKINPRAGVPFMVMEFLAGEGLDKRLEVKGALSPMQLLGFMQDLACVLDEAHGGESHDGKSPIVHRDLKPENLFLARAEGGELLKVLDFGIAKVVNEFDGHASQIIGSPLYMAPEQWEPLRELSPRTDVWALGLVVFCALTGEVFWERHGIQSLAQQVLLHPIPLASARAKALGVTLPLEFDAWFARCVARKPDGRFASAGAAVTELANVVGRWPGLHAKTESQPPPPPPDPPPPPPGVGLDVKLRNRRSLPLAEVRVILRELAEKVEDVRTPETTRASLVLTPEHVRFVKRDGREEVELWQVVPTEPSAAERRGTHTILARFGVADFAYFAPETLRASHGSPQADVWSLALLAFEMLTGVRFWPQESIPEMLHAIETSARARRPSARRRCRVRRRCPRASTTGSRAARGPTPDRATRPRRARCSTSKSSSRRASRRDLPRGASPRSSPGASPWP